MRISTPEGIELDGLGLNDYAIKIDHTNKTLEWRENETTNKLSYVQKLQMEEAAEKKYPGYNWMREYKKGDVTVWASSQEEANNVFKQMNV